MGAGGRGRGKAKGKGKKAMKVMKAAAAPVEGQENPGGGEMALAIVPKAKSAAGGLRKKVLDECAGKELDVVLAEKKSGLSIFAASLQEAQALAKAMEGQVTKAQGEFDAATKAVTASMEAEAKAATKMRELKMKKSVLSEKTNESRKHLLEAQKKLTTLEVYQLSHQKIKALEEARQAAAKAAEDAKKALTEQKQKEKEAMEETRRRLQEARGGVKRPAPAANAASANVD